jgi:6-phosphofructokinase 1
VDGQAIVQDVRCVVDERGHCVIALSEGAVPDIGTSEVDAFGHRMKGGAADYVAEVISDQLDLKVRMDKPNYLQRSFSSTMSTVDADEAYCAGRSAVQLATQGQSGVMVTLERETGAPYSCGTGTAPLAKVANAEKLLPDQYINKQGNDVTAAFLDYALPLIGDPLPPLGRLEQYSVPPRTQ